MKNGDRLITTKLQRLGRSAREVWQTVKTMNDQGVTVQILDLAVADDSDSGKLVMNQMAAFAELERSALTERTQTGRAVAREKGQQIIGRKEKITPDQINYALNLLENNYS